MWKPFAFFSSRISRQYRKGKTYRVRFGTLRADWCESGASERGTGVLAPAELSSREDAVLAVKMVGVIATRSDRRLRRFDPPLMKSWQR
jgi:hypothetical protein